MSTDIVGSPYPDGSDIETVPECSGGNEFDGRLGLRIAALFVILVGSTLGEVLIETRSLTLTCHLQEQCYPSLPGAMRSNLCRRPYSLFLNSSAPASSLRLLSFMWVLPSAFTEA